MDLQTFKVGEVSYRQIGHDKNGVSMFREVSEDPNAKLEALSWFTLSARPPVKGRPAKAVLRFAKPVAAEPDANGNVRYNLARYEVSFIHATGASLTERSSLYDSLRAALSNISLALMLRDAEPVV